MEEIVLGGGCFWCIEAVMNQLKGVHEALSGYAGGTVEDPTYEQVCSGTTGHAEVVQVSFDPEIISLHDILTVFFTLHDPTTLNRQGADVGTQYRSVIFYADEEQRQEAMKVMEEISEQGVWEDPLVTELAPLEEFYEAEAYHQRYFEQNPNQGYCRAIIAPKVAKLRKEFVSMLSEE